MRYILLKLDLKNLSRSQNHSCKYEWVNIPVCDFQTKSLVIWEPSVLKSRFLLRNIWDTASWNLGVLFFNPPSPPIIGNIFTGVVKITIVNLVSNLYKLIEGVFEMPWWETACHLLVLCKTTDFSSTTVFHPFSHHKKATLCGCRSQGFLMELWCSVRGPHIKFTIKQLNWHAKNSAFIVWYYLLQPSWMRRDKPVKKALSLNLIISSSRHNINKLIKHKIYTMNLYF